MTQRVCLVDGFKRSGETYYLYVEVKPYKSREPDQSKDHDMKLRRHEYFKYYISEPLFLQ